MLILIKCRHARPLQPWFLWMRTPQLSLPLAERGRHLHKPMPQLKPGKQDLRPTRKLKVSCHRRSCHQRMKMMKVLMFQRPILEMRELLKKLKEALQCPPLHSQSLPRPLQRSLTPQPLLIMAQCRVCAPSQESVQPPSHSFLRLCHQVCMPLQNCWHFLRSCLTWLGDFNRDFS